MTVERAIEVGLRVTSGGVLVRIAQTTTPTDGKVWCYRYPTGGRHGLLWARNLRMPTSADLRRVGES